MSDSLTLPEERPKGEKFTKYLKIFRAIYVRSTCIKGPKRGNLIKYFKIFMAFIDGPFVVNFSKVCPLTNSITHLS